MANRVIDVWVVYQIVKKLSTPFEKTEAFKLELIDRNGNLLKKRREMSRTEKKAVTHLDLLIFNLKRLLARLPGGDSQIRNFASALFLLREDADQVDVEDVAFLANQISEGEEKPLDDLMEEISSSIGSGSVDNTTVAVSNVGKCRVYDVDSKTFHGCRRIKDKKERFAKFVADDATLNDMREFAKKNPGHSIGIRNNKNGAVTMLKMGSRFQFS